jgi:hypothetical protein
MPNRPLLYCATDKEIFDVLMSSRQHFSENALLDLARSRSLILSPYDDREDLAEKLAVMIFGFNEVRAIQAVFERSGRGEKTTSFRLNGEITAAEIREAAIAYGAEVGEEETVVPYGAGPAAVTVDLKYTETDFSKTRLRQRQTREATIDFKIEDGYTTVTLPATGKARAVAEAMRAQLNTRREAALGVEEVDLSTISNPLLRSAFFTRMISSLPYLRLQNVTRVKVDRAEKAEPILDDGEVEDANDSDEASAEMLGIVRAVALHGEDLLLSNEYQSLHKRGFSITSITWSCRRTVSPYQQVEFDAGFEEPAIGVGFKYSVRGWATQKDGEYTKSFRPMPMDEKKSFLNVIEKTAVAVFRQIRHEFAAADGGGRDSGGVE